MQELYLKETELKKYNKLLIEKSSMQIFLDEITKNISILK